MPRTKLKRFAEIKTLPNIVTLNEELEPGWLRGYFENERPVTLELACGWGEYTLNLAKWFPERHFVGVDLKGERLWKGAKIALQENLHNVVFLQRDIAQLADCFPEKSVEEIWLPFPDPRPKKRHLKHRLTAPRFLHVYRRILRTGGRVHLKTDDDGLYEFTLEALRAENAVVHTALTDLYSADIHETWSEKPKSLPEGVSPRASQYRVCSARTPSRREAHFPT
ncbi:MAG: tRNA (guanosine(46)-N7)-methyltransferase TrmB, partial [bacterium]